MNDSNRRKKYMRDVYSKTWSKTRKKYGVGQYDKDLIYELSRTLNDGKILEVAIGDGFPYAHRFDKMGYEVFGIDIAPNLVNLVKKELPNIKVQVGDAEDLKFPESFFDGVYCFRSSWYFPNLTKSIDEMLRVVKKHGVVMFDIQNMNHPIHHKSVINQEKKRNDPLIKIIMVRYVKNFIKTILRPIIYYPLDWSLNRHVIVEIATDPQVVKSYLKRRDDVKYHLYGVVWNDPITLKKIDETGEHKEFDRLVYKLQIV